MDRWLLSVLYVWQNLQEEFKIDKSRMRFKEKYCSKNHKQSLEPLWGENSTCRQSLWEEGKTAEGQNIYVDLLKVLKATARHGYGRDAMDDYNRYNEQVGSHGFGVEMKYLMAKKIHKGNTFNFHSCSYQFS